MQGSRTGSGDRAGRRAASRGFTLLEMMVALSVLTVGLLGFTSFFVVNARTHDYVTEQSLAIHSLREIAETIRASPFSAAAVNYDGYTFTIDDIKAAGTVTVFTDETDKSPDAKMLGLPRDLDGDGKATSQSIWGGYYLLPIKIEVTWNNLEGPQSETLYQMLAQEVN